MQVKTVESGRGAAWLLDGFDYFKRDALNWMIVTVVIFVIAFVLKWIPLIGDAVFQVLSPVFAGGLMLGCREQDRGGKLEVQHLFAGFQTNSRELFLLGVLYFAGVLLIVFVAFACLAVFGIGLGQMMSMVQPGGAARIGFNPLMALVAMLIALGASVPLLMAIWFAPALVVLDNLAATDALKRSFAGCLANVVPILVYGVVSLVFAILATLPLGLGWLVLIPMITASIYISYKDIFPAATAPA